jgi:peroxiredoxin Q/BCP
LARLRDDYAEFKSRGAEVLALGPDSTSSFREYWTSEKLPFIGLPDLNRKVAVRYRQEVNLFKLGRMPLVCVVDAQGLIRYAHYAVSMSDIPENKVLLAVIDELNASSK